MSRALPFQITLIAYSGCELANADPIFELAPGLSMPAMSNPSLAGAQMTSPETRAFHGQMTNVTQWHSRFRAPYGGTNSLHPVVGRKRQPT